MNTLIRTPFRLLPLALLALACASISPQNVARAAGWSRDAPSVTVSFSDLDLSKPRGTATPYTRIRSAARTVCGTVDIRLVEEVNWGQCVDQSIANAVAEVGDPNLTAYYLAKTHRSYGIDTAQISRPQQRPLATVLLSLRSSPPKCRATAHRPPSSRL
jgi:UrcA family protein